MESRLINNEGNNDYIIGATAANGSIRAFAAVTTEMVQKAHELHQTSAVASAALGRTMTAAAMISKMFKSERDMLTIQIKGEGPLGGIVVVSDYSANVRGYVYNPIVELPLNAAGKLDVAGAIGDNGYLNVIKDLGMKEPYIGYVELISGEIA
ncbi:MAG: Hsp33 family molecular chaperone HslO, partial [Clostridiales bacterium]|nr:Hsp33 family molecular chaperone HslO [Clostridiales bacterium]